MSKPLVYITATTHNVTDSLDEDVEHLSKGDEFIKRGASYTRTFWIILYYACCSSTMLIVNKVAIYHLKAPTFVLFCQLAASASAVFFASSLGFLVSDKIEKKKIKKFIWVIVGFLGTIFANMKVLQNANVETFITFRSSTPLVLSFCDYYFLGRHLPKRRSWLCLLVLILGSIGYVAVDADFKLDAYGWLLVWFVFFTFDSVYVKHMCNTVKMTNWGRVYYTNLLALPPLLFVLPGLDEQHVLRQTTWGISVVAPLVLSCVIGLGMSHSSYLLRETVSATLFTIVGIVCKVITVIVNCLIWSNHATAPGIGFLMVCVLAGTFYEQAPLRDLEPAEKLRKPEGSFPFPFGTAPKEHK